MKRTGAFFVSLLCAAVMIPLCFAAPYRVRAAVSDYNEQGVYQALLAMKSQYPEGMKFDNSTPYNSKNNPYVWHPARLNTGGCAAFAAILSDTVFGTALPVREYEDIRSARAGDVLRYYAGANEHTVIVLQKLSDSVEVAEGNYGGTVHWGRKISFTELQNNKRYFYTRDPVRGDTDLSGNVSVEDVQLALGAYTNQVSGKNNGLSVIRHSCADADRNGSLTIVDVQMILIYYTRNVVSRQNVPWEQILS